MNWFKQDKYGLFIHYGLYSILGGEYQGRVVPGIAEWIMHQGNIPRAEYAKLTARFNPLHFDAEAICRRAKAWGMRYVCLTAKHHDGYALFDSAADAYNSVKASVSGRDLVGEMAEACRRQGLKFCLYYSQAQDWHHPDGYEAYRDNSGKNFRRYLTEKCFPQVRELLTQYGPLSMLWFDTPMGMSPEESRELRDLVKQLQPDCLISGRIGNGLGDYMTTQDNRIPAFPIEGLWEVPATLNHTWGYKKSDTDWASAGTILHRLLRIVARGGNYLLNVGPEADGRIPAASCAILDEVGRWLAGCGEAIYGSSAIPPYVYEAPELVFTHKPHKLYIHLLNAPQYAGRKIVLPNVANHIRSAGWLNCEAAAEIQETFNLEGDPLWYFMVPENFAEKNILTLAVSTEEAAFQQKML